MRPNRNTAPSPDRKATERRQAVLTALRAAHQEPPIKTEEPAWVTGLRGVIRKIIAEEVRNVVSELKPDVPARIRGQTAKR